MDSFKSIIEAIGVAPLAELFGLDESHVRVMKTRDSIPAEYWGVLVEHRSDITYAQLRGMRDARFDRRGKADTVAA